MKNIKLNKRLTIYCVYTHYEEFGSTDGQLALKNGGTYVTQIMKNAETKIKSKCKSLNIRARTQKKHTSLNDNRFFVCKTRVGYSGAGSWSVIGNSATQREANHGREESLAYKFNEAHKRFMWEAPKRTRTRSAHTPHAHVVNEALTHESHNRLTRHKIVIIINNILFILFFNYSYSFHYIIFYIIHTLVLLLFYLRKIR